MNFFMKILEKLNLWEFEDFSLVFVPFQDAQFGFRKGRSTETCLTVTYQYIEHGIVKGYITVAIYLDIEGCYDNLQNHKMLEALRRRGAREEYVRWYEDFLYHRNIKICHKGEE